MNILIFSLRRRFQNLQQTDSRQFIYFSQSAYSLKNYESPDFTSRAHTEINIEVVRLTLFLLRALDLSVSVALLDDDTSSVHDNIIIAVVTEKCGHVCCTHKIMPSNDLDFNYSVSLENDITINESAAVFVLEKRTRANQSVLRAHARSEPLQVYVSSEKLAF